MSLRTMALFRAATLLLGTLSASCTSGPEFVSDFHRRAWQATVDVAPAVEEIFGTEYYCKVAVTDDSIPGLAGTNESRQTIVFAEKAARFSDEVLRFIAAHELAHVHMRDFWETLPASTQEGVAELVAIRVVPNVRDALAVPVVTSDTTSVIALAGYVLSIDGENKEAYELVERIGFSGVQTLAKRAFQRGEHVSLEQLQEWVIAPSN